MFLVIKGHPALRYRSLQHLFELVKIDAPIVVDVIHTEEELDGRICILAGKLGQCFGVLVHKDTPYFLPVKNCECPVNEQLLQLLTTIVSKCFKSIKYMTCIL